MTVKFKVTEVCDIRKQGSEVAVGNILTGEIDATGHRVFYKDRADVEWIFYVGDTCEIVPDKPLNI